MLIVSSWNQQRCNCQKFIGEKGEKDTSLGCDFEIFGATLFGGQLCGATLFGAELCGAKYLRHIIWCRQDTLQGGV